MSIPEGERWEKAKETYDREAAINEAAWQEFKSANEDDEVWARLAAEAREDDFAAWIDEQILEEAARLNPMAPKCADTMHQFHSFDVCATCGFVTERSV